MLLVAFVLLAVKLRRRSKSLVFWIMEPVLRPSQLSAVLLMAAQSCLGNWDDLQMFSLSGYRTLPS